MSGYAKSILATVAAGLSAGVVALTGDATIDSVERINIAIAVVGAVGVWYVPNAATGRVAKAVVASLMAVLTLAVNLIADGVTLSEWLQLALAGMAAIGVYGVQNTPSTTPRHVQ